MTADGSTDVDRHLDGEDPAAAPAVPQDSTHRRQPVLNWLGRQFLPGGGPRPRALEIVLVLVAGALLGFFRLGSAAIDARVWAEDGRVFLEEADKYGPFRSMTISYAGYLHGAPRLAAALVHPLPVRLWGVGVHITDAIFLAWAALAVYLGLSDQVRSRLGRAVAALYVVLIPVSPEVTGSIANLQWSLLVSGIVVLLWTPRSAWGWAFLCATTLLVTTSSPLAAIVFALALIRLVLQRGRGAVAVFAVTTVGFAAQSIEMLRVPQRPVVPLLHVYGYDGLAKGYVARIAGDGVLGIDRLTDGKGSSLVPGYIVLITLLTVIVVAAARRWAGPWGATALLLVASVATYLTAVLLRSRPMDLTHAISSGRYYAIPTQLFVIALIVTGFGVGERLLPARTARTSSDGSEDRVVDARADDVRADDGRADDGRADDGRAGDGRAGGATRVGRRPRARTTVVERGARAAFGLAVAALVGALAFSLTTNYEAADIYGRKTTPSWSSTVEIATLQCRDNPLQRRVHLRIAPIQPDWEVSLLCSTLR